MVPDRLPYGFSDVVEKVLLLPTVSDIYLFCYQIFILITNYMLPATINVVRTDCNVAKWFYFPILLLKWSDFITIWMLSCNVI